MSRLPVIVAMLIGVAMPVSAQTPDASKVDMSDKLPAGADQAAIVKHLLDAERTHRNTSAIIIQFPDLSRQQAYDIQFAILTEKEKTEKRVGWKIGYSRNADPSKPDAVVFGHIMASNVFQSEDILPASHFPNDTLVVEGEFAVWIGKDLPGPVVTRQQVVDAISGIGAGIELVSSWTRPPVGMRSTHDHDITGNVFHAGAIFGSNRVPAPSLDFTKETVIVEIDGVQKNTGVGVSIMKTDPIEAVVWLANELPKYTRTYLRAGDVILSGTVFPPPPIGAGNRAKVAFTTIGSLEVGLK